MCQSPHAQPKIRGYTLISLLAQDKLSLASLLCSLVISLWITRTRKSWKHKMTKKFNMEEVWWCNWGGERCPPVHFKPVMCPVCQNMHAQWKGVKYPLPLSLNWLLIITSWKDSKAISANEVTLLVLYCIFSCLRTVFCFSLRLKKQQQWIHLIKVFPFYNWFCFAFFISNGMFTDNFCSFVAACLNGHTSYNGKFPL